MWVLLLALTCSTLVLFRFSLKAYRTHAPPDVGDVGSMNGPPLDAAPPVIELRGMGSESIVLGRPGGSVQLVVFAKSGCSKCKAALPVLHAFAIGNPRLQIVVVCGGDYEAAQECASVITLPLMAAADLNWAAGKTWHVSNMPFGVVLDAAGIVRGRGDPTSASMLTLLNWYLENASDAAPLRIDDTTTFATNDQGESSIRTGPSSTRSPNGVAKF
jgi:hypothetical protein